jgi:alkylation response protein AidB-like acyl-CoA dehydrogenase
MDLEPSPDQEALRAELRRFLDRRVTSESRRACAAYPGSVDRALWSELAALGVFGVLVPESRGGLGLGLAEAAIVAEELGRAAVPGPLAATLVGAALSDGAAAGEEILGIVEPARPLLVEHLEALDALLVVTERSVARVEPPQPTATGAVARPLDPLTPLHVLDAMPAGGTPLGDAECVDRLRRDAALVAAAQQIGLGQAALDLGTAHAAERVQFGRVIGSFQAVKHLLADAHVDLDVARAAVHAAAVEEDEARAGAAAVRPTCGIDAARVVAARAARRATAACVQVHGGMGYTWELDAHLFLKRVEVLDVWLQRPEAALEARARRLVPAG